MTTAWRYLEWGSAGKPHREDTHQARGRELEMHGRSGLFSTKWLDQATVHRLGLVRQRLLGGMDPALVPSALCQISVQG